MLQRQASTGLGLATTSSELRPGSVWRWPLHGIPRRVDRLLTRLIARLALAQVVEIRNWEGLLPRHDPFILVANHGSRREALYLGTLCLFLRSGKPVRFLADWNFRLYPGVGYFYDRSGCITVPTKPARLRFLNGMRRRYQERGAPFDQARTTLADGGSVGIFPEGTVNRSASRLMRGRYGAARLSLETGVPLLPVGVRFQGPPRPNGSIDSSSPITLEVGSPIAPPSRPGPVARSQVHDWHRQMMTALAAHCGKVWTDRGPALDEPEVVSR